MSISEVFEGDSTSSSKFSLAEVRAAILADEGLAAARRRDLASAVSAFAKAIGRPAEGIPAEPAVLRPILHKLTPAMVGKKPGRWRNILSLLGAALAHAGVVVVQGRIKEAPLPAWKVMLKLTSPNTSARYHLSRFGRYCSATGIMPEDVTDATIAKYQHDLETRSLVDDPKRSAREVTRAWNATAVAQPEWPQTKLAIPDNRIIFSLEWDAYPATLKADHDAFLEWLAGDDPFCERPSAGLRPASIATRSKQIRAYLGALAIQGVDPQELVDLKSAVTLDRIKLALRFFWNKAGKKPTPHTAQMAGVALMIARHWATLTDDKIKAIKAVTDRMRPKSTGMTERNISRLRALEEPRRLDMLLALPSTLFDMARRTGEPSVHAALLVQTAVAVEVLLLVPMRMRNLQGLRLGTHFIRTPKEQMFIVHSGEDVKNGTRIDAGMPKDAVKLIGAYIDKYRPLLNSAGGDWLFPGRTADKPKCDVALREQLTKAIGDHCGLEFHPHLFRHFAAWITLRENPNAHGQVQRILGHKSLHSTMAYYSGLESSAALAKYDSLIGRSREAPASRKAVSRKPAISKPSGSSRLSFDEEAA
jgi:integrase